MGNKTSSAIKVLQIGSNSDGNGQNLYPGFLTQPSNPGGETMQWPFAVYLPRVLQPGDKVEVEGKIADNAEIFSINLVSEHTNDIRPNNVAYHHKVNFNENYTILNSKENGTWQTEERNDDMVLEQGNEFKLMLLIMEDEIRAYYNDEYHSSFMHRLPFDSVRLLQIWDGIEFVKSLKMTFA